MRYSFSESNGQCPMFAESLFQRPMHAWQTQSIDYESKNLIFTLTFEQCKWNYSILQQNSYWRARQVYAKMLSSGEEDKPPKHTPASPKWGLRTILLINSEWKRPRHHLVSYGTGVPHWAFSICPIHKTPKLEVDSESKIKRICPKLPTTYVEWLIVPLPVQRVSVEYILFYCFCMCFYMFLQFDIICYKQPAT